MSATNTLTQRCSCPSGPRWRTESAGIEIASTDKRGAGERGFEPQTICRLAGPGPAAEGQPGMLGTLALNVPRSVHLSPNSQATLEHGIACALGAILRRPQAK